MNARFCFPRPASGFAAHGGTAGRSISLCAGGQRLADHCHAAVRGARRLCTLVSSDTFPSAAAIKNQTDNGYVQSFTLTGSQTVNGQSYRVAGSGTVTVSAAVASTFEGQSALLSNQAVSGSLQVKGVTAPFSSTAQEYATPSYALFGIVVTIPPNPSSEYCVMQGSPTVPVTVKVGDSGAIGTCTCYTDSSKTTALGTRQVSYVVQAHTEHTAIIKLVEQDYDSGLALQLTDQVSWRIDTNANLTWVSETATVPTHTYVFK
ncbi:MAG TPA: hypothetical protein VEP67_10335 [Thiobacillaceae bacterium]|nr:hypothetical protein [Thiobacillaceae bacterium]